MSNRVCPTCGEEYSDTYRTCPFCEEEKAIRQGHPPHRQGGRRLEKQRAKGGGGAGGVLMLLTVVIIAGALAYVFFGEKIADTMGIRSDPAELGFTTDDEPPVKDDPEEAPPVTQPESALTMSQPAMTLAAGETALLTVSGVEGDVVWSTSDEQIATVDGGAVTAKAGGTAVVTAVIGEESAVCSVEVEGDPPAPPAAEPSTQPSSGGASGVTLSLNKTDFTLRSGDPPVQMKVKGTESAVTWASKNTSVVTVSDSGLVTRVGSGRTTVTATVDGQTLECTVRVP